MVVQYNNSTRPMRRRHYLTNIKLSTIMGNEDCDVTSGVEKLCDIINKSPFFFQGHTVFGPREFPSGAYLCCSLMKLPMGLPKPALMALWIGSWDLDR